MKAMPHVTSTKELPPRIPNMPDDTRSKVIQELYTTEYTYVKGLEVLSEVGGRGLVYGGCGLSGRGLVYSECGQGTVDKTCVS